MVNEPKCPRPIRQSGENASTGGTRSDTVRYGLWEL